MLSLLLMTGSLATANNLQITNVTATTSSIQFNISWENSWRVSTAPKNHDAVWIFIKRIDCATNQWSHVDLSPSAGNHYADDPLEIYIDGRDGAAAAKGLFLRRKADGVGNIVDDSISINIINMPAGEFDFEVFGIEMVQIPEGSFYLGDGASQNSFRSSSNNNPRLVNNESSISSTTLRSINSYPPTTLPTAYPKGYKEIYCMKYEITQGQYISFLNALQYDQAADRNVPALGSNRFIYTGSWPNFVSTTPHRAMTNMIWDDMAAYLDWSALRPMTELEFEKIARGPSYPVANEYAWGNTSITKVAGLSNDGTPAESSSTTVAPGHGTATYAGTPAGPNGPLRSGFAAKPGTNRVSSGAGYYGVMDLSGNVTEMTVGTYTSAASSFTGKLGNGEISTTPAPGLPDVTGWPNYSGRTLKGGSWQSPIQHLSVSDRTLSNYHNNSRYNYVGGRGVR
ncbi:hypothetical protein CW751_05170 [Brumimicrobium salinarum]|uniref:Sulfatase-modifying factor enzyme-like domain-containing protein n=2 Tax=Brumimicrobium salinarum TaxID=2058658 RepID=A0A2I0R4G3_9FLAO|nr:hypothetical protein CW751_05170 [Brumimicrobium salinarum]